jgi:uncharacterized membrane protein
MIRDRPDTLPEPNHDDVTSLRAEANANARLEAFCDGVFAIALTLLIVDIRPPDAAGIRSAGDLWRALGHLTPSVLAFLLSFVVVFITWENHRSALRLARGSTPSFVFANGFLLLTVVFIPFPTALLGANILTDHAAPAVVLYDAVVAIQALAWLAVCRAALNNHLVDGERAIERIRENERNSYFALALYSSLAVAAVWFPTAVAIVTTGSWVFWLALGLRQHPE